MFYGIAKGVREICKKKALETSPTMEVLFVYSLISFLVLIPDIKNVFGLEPIYFLYIAIKAFVIFIAWICGFKAIKKLPISLYGVLDLSRVTFSSLLGIVVLNEIMRPLKIAGMVLVCIGLVLLKKPSRKRSSSGTNDAEDSSAVKPVYVIVALLSCLLNAVSGLMDKILMRSINESQLQFWYMLFLVLMYLGFILVTRTKIDVKRAVTNKWIWILSILFVLADRALFIANSYTECTVTTQTLLKQSGVIVVILSSRFLFKEKDITHKLICACIVIAGIVLGTIA